MARGSQVAYSGKDDSLESLRRPLVDARTGAQMVDIYKSGEMVPRREGIARKAARRDFVVKTSFAVAFLLSVVVVVLVLLLGDRGETAPSPTSTPTSVPDPGPAFGNGFSDDMVLQRGHNITATLYGPLGGASELTVYVSGTSQQGAKIDYSVPVVVDFESSTWRAQLRPSTGGKVDISLVESQNETGILRNVVFGDVWFCSGQSNMALFFSKTFNHKPVSELLGNGKWDDRLRMFNAVGMDDVDLARDKIEFVQPQTSRVWRTASALSKSDQDSALCLYFGLQLSEQLDKIGDIVPIGLVHSAIGGSEIGAWVDHHSLEKCGIRPDLDGKPRVPPESLFNGAIAPFVNMTISGWLWYQGENNVGNTTPDQYACLLESLINLWRGLWSASGDKTTPGNAPFGVVELAPSGSEGHGDRFGLFRAMQVKVASKVDNAFPVISYDLPDPWNARQCEKAGCCPFANGTSPAPFVPGKECITQDQCLDGKGLDGDWGSNLPKPYMGPIHPRLKRRIGNRAALGALSVMGLKGAQSAKFDSCDVKEHDGEIDVSLKLDSAESLQVLPKAYRAVNSSVLQICVAPDTDQGKNACQCLAWQYIRSYDKAVPGEWKCEFPAQGQGMKPGSLGFRPPPNPNLKHWQTIDLSDIVVDTNNVLSFKTQVNETDTIWAAKFGWEDNCCVNDKRVEQGFAPCPPLACGIFSAESELPPQPFFLALHSSKGSCEAL